MKYSVRPYGAYIRISIEEIDDDWMTKKEAKDLLENLKDMVEELENRIE